MTDGKTSPKYNIAIVEQVILEEIAELHPRHLPVQGLSLRIITDAEDRREMETAVQAIHNLRECGLLSYRDDEIVKPTPAALRAVRLLT